MTYGWQELTSTTWMAPYVPHPQGPQHIESSKGAPDLTEASVMALYCRQVNFSNKGESPARSYILNSEKSFNIRHRQDGTESSTGDKKADAERP